MGKTKKSGAEIVTLKVDKEPVARNPSEKDILWWCVLKVSDRIYHLCLRML